MRKLLYIILFCMTFAACKTTSESIKKDLEVNSVTNYDSIYERFLHIDDVMYEEIQRTVYDSVITHVTIVRYDTIVINGEPIIKEKIIIEQVEVSGESTDEQRLDSIKATDAILEDVAIKDTIQIERHEQTQRKQLKKGDLFTFILFILIVLLSYICIEQYKAKR